MMTHPTPAIKKDAASLFINYAISFTQKPDADAKTHALTSVMEILQNEADAEEDEADGVMIYRLLVVVGTLVYNDPGCTALAMDLELPTICAAAAAACPDDTTV